MRSPQISTAVVAIIIAAIAFFVFGKVDPTPLSIAIFVLVVAFIAPLIGSDSTVHSETSDEVKTLYVGNLPYRANEASVRELFSEQGQVHSVRLMKDKHTGKRRGFGFVEISAADADKAVTALNDTEFQQRTLKVREAKERPDKSLEDE
ncbi:MAG: RNA recognition motif-containing protein [Alteromonadaceae bacterium]|jgi:RNA recognition motif-containing protein